MDLNGKTVVLTGATSGLGFDIAKTLANNNVNLAVCGRSAEKMHQLISELNLDKSRLLFETFDITDFSQANGFINKAITEFGKVDVLINCAGANSSRDNVANIDTHELNKMMLLNVYAPLNMMQQVYNESMVRHQQGMIINILSTVCLYSNTGIGSYTASKSALDALSKVFRKEAREHNVKVCSIYPGGIDTPFREAERPEHLSTEPVVNAVLTMIQQSPNSCIDELVIRPMVERNFS